MIKNPENTYASIQSSSKGSQKMYITSLKNHKKGQIIYPLLLIFHLLFILSFYALT